MKSKNYVIFATQECRLSSMLYCIVLDWISDVHCKKTSVPSFIFEYKVLFKKILRPKSFSFSVIDGIIRFNRIALGIGCFVLSFPGWGSFHPAKNQPQTQTHDVKNEP
jgi:hypothetical protein